MQQPRNKIEAQALIKELERRRTQKDIKLFVKTPRQVPASELDFFLSRCHAKQQEFLLDKNKLLALLCPRRTGKTTASLFKALMTTRMHPGAPIAYIVPSSKSHAQRLFWRPLEEMNISLNLGLEFKVAENRVITPEGSNIIVFGAKNKSSPAILRGNAWALAILDECKDFGSHFEELMIESVMPGLEDYDGTLVLEGTPGEVLDGIFYRVTMNQPEGWSVHKWTKAVNTFMPPDKRDLDNIERTIYWPMGLTKESPKFRREQLAEWCTDDTERVYMYDPHRNDWDGVLPEGHQWYYVLGLDLGERDANAFVVGAFARTCLELYIVYDFARNRMSIDEIASETKRLQRQFGPFAEMVADTGGYGRGIVTDMQIRHNLAFKSADKKGNKLGTISLMNSDFLLGRIRCQKTLPLAQEWMRLTRKVRPGDKKVILSHSDRGDAALYMWKASKHYAATIVNQGPLQYTEEWYEMQECKQMARAAKIRDQRNANWWGQAVTDIL